MNNLDKSILWFGGVNIGYFLISTIEGHYIFSIFTLILGFYATYIGMRSK